MVTTKKKKTLSLDDKAKFVRIYALLQWKGLKKSAAALAKEAGLDIPDENSPRPQLTVWSLLSPPEEESGAKQESESGSDSSDSVSDDTSESSDSEEDAVQVSRKTTVLIPEY